MVREAHVHIVRICTDIAFSITRLADLCNFWPAIIGCEGRASVISGGLFRPGTRNELEDGGSRSMRDAPTGLLMFVYTGFKYRASWRRGPLRQKLCNGLLEPTGPWGQESQLTLAPTGSHPHRPAGRTKIVLPSPWLPPIHHPNQCHFSGGRVGETICNPRGERCRWCCQWFWKYVVIDA